MTKKMKAVWSYATALMLSAALGACGGGGGGSASPTPTPTPTSAATNDASTLVTSVPASTYATASEELATYTLLNQERQRCGFGLLAQSTKLDQAARAHANWLMVNNYSGHIETPSAPTGFTGVGPANRAAAAGYTTTLGVGETIADTTGAATAPGYATIATRQLLAAPYHLNLMMSTALEMGIGALTSDTAGTTSRQIVVFNFGTPSPATAGQLLDGSTVATYPCQGSTGTAKLVNGEDPNPVPGRDLSTSPIGQPILIAVRTGNTLTLTAATVTNLTTGLPVALLPLRTSANDTSGELAANVGFVMPNQPLAANTSYQVVVSGTDNGTAFNRSFTFTTGS